MKRIGSSRLAAPLLCLLLCLALSVSALAEELAPITVSAAVEESSVIVRFSADAAHAVTVSLIQYDGQHNEIVLFSRQVGAGKTGARFDNVPPDAYTVKVSYDPNEAPGAAPALLPIVVKPVEVVVLEEVQEPELPVEEIVLVEDLPSDTPVPTEVPAPTEAPAPAETAAPVDADIPVDTPVPADTAIPTEETAPTEAPAPTDTPAPAEIPVIEEELIPVLPDEDSGELIEEIILEETVPEPTLEPTPEPTAEPEVAVISALPAVGDGSIAISIMAWNRPVIVALMQGGETLQTRRLETGSGTATFQNLLPGSYDVRIDYETPVEGFSALTLSDVVVPETRPAALPVVAAATVGTESITVQTTSASALPVSVTLLLGSAVQDMRVIEGGIGTVVFEHLAAGVYTVSVNYAPPQEGITASVYGDLVVRGKPAPIALGRVTAGENCLNVTGTAQPDADVTFTTEPATLSTVAHTDASGSFAATLVCPAGTYTAVYAQYGGDAQSRATATGSFVVTAPLVRPTLEIDRIHAQTLIVYARTTPGALVNLGTADYGQTVTADSRGILRYSLPHPYALGTPITFTVFYGKDNVQTYKQTVTVSEPYYFEQLKRGMKKTTVFELTTRLCELGYLDNPTVTYSDAVVSAVRLFQSLNGLTVDGIAGVLTQEAAFSVSAIALSERGVYPTLVRGDRDLSIIYSLQQRLKDLGYYTIKVDGIFGSGTQRAVREFQRVNGLSATGQADNATQQLLFSSAARAAKKPSDDSKASYASLSRSSRYKAAVVPLQRRLKELGYYAGNIDGYFGSQTYRAVRAFQSRNGLTVNGVANSRTQELLYSASAKSVTGALAATGYRLLYKGCKGDDVRRLQQALLDAGYKQVRTADGIFGQWTYDGVRAFQKDKQLAVDGIAGRDTQNALYGTNY